MKSFKTEAVIIKKRNFGEKDRILTLFTPHLGKIEALAKGARRPGSRLSANSDIATIADFHIQNTRSIDIISEINAIYHPDGALGEFEKTQKLGFALKLIDRLYEMSDPHPKTFHILKEVVESISDEKRQLLFLAFLVNILLELGAYPDLFNCIYCHKPISEKEKITFSSTGGLAHQTCCTDTSCAISDNEVKLLRVLAQESFSRISRMKVDKKVFENSYNILTTFIEWHFGKILPDGIL